MASTCAPCARCRPIATRRSRSTSAPRRRPRRSTRARARSGEGQESATDDLKVVPARPAPSRPTTTGSLSTVAVRRPRRTTTAAKRGARARVTCTPRLPTCAPKGVTAAEASGRPPELLLAEASSLIDRVTGWFFEPRLLTLRISPDGAARRASSCPCRRSASTGSLLGSSELSGARPERAAHRRRPVQPGFRRSALHAATGACSRAGTATWPPRGLGLHRGRRHAHGAHAARDPPRDDAPRPAPKAPLGPTTPSFEAQSLAHHRGATRDQSYRLGRRPRLRASPHLATRRSTRSCALREAHALGAA